MSEEIVEITNGTKTLKRKKVDWEINQKIWELRGYSLVVEKPKLAIVPKKKKSKK